MAIWRVPSGDRHSGGSSSAGYTVAAEVWGSGPWATCLIVCGLSEWKFGGGQNASLGAEPGECGCKSGL